jgi:hypothetical protein
MFRMGCALKRYTSQLDSKVRIYYSGQCNPDNIKGGKVAHI